ncbi:MAG TPA: hypothetical protein VGG44_11210 [Tepidisphaeraceae bacterium]|jgi:hypothetical protein
MCSGKSIWLTILPLALLVFLSAGADDAAKGPLTIQKIPATIAKHTYDPANPDPQMPAPDAGEAGVTVSEYGCVAEVSGQISSTKKSDSDATVTVKVANIHITLKLDVTEWMSQVAPQKIWYHEDGHRKIAMHFYEHADEVVAKIAREWIGQSLTASGSDASAAAKEAITEIAKKIAAAYMVHVRDQSELVQEAYDRITSHGTNNIDESDAIRQALREVAQADTRPADSKPSDP